MAGTMTASQQPMTDGQIDNLVDKFRAAARKHRAELASDAVQQVLGVENLGMELLEPFRKRVEAVSNMIVRRVKVDRSQSPQKALDATGCRQYTDSSVVAVMPRGDGDEGDVFFFRPNFSSYGGHMSDADVGKEFNSHGLKPCDPYKLAQVNTDDPAFADKHPNTTYWQDKNGNWCYVAFNRWRDGRSVHVYRSARDWADSWWFAGLRK